jgi:hypothetical protein
LVLGSTDTTPRAVVYGELTTGADWSDVPPPGAKKLSRFTYARSGVRVDAFATFDTRSFWLAQKAESFDGVLWVRPNQKVRVSGVDSGEAIVEIDESRTRPSLVTGRAACEDLGTDTTVHTEESPLPGLPVHAKNLRWLHLRAQPNGPVERDVQATSPITKTIVQNGFVLVHVRFAAVDATGWVASSELTEQSNRYGTAGIGQLYGRATGACNGRPLHRVKKTSTLRVGPTGNESEALGQILENAQTMVREIDGGFARIDVPSCEIMPAGNQSFWVDADALE